MCDHGRSAPAGQTAPLRADLDVPPADAARSSRPNPAPDPTTSATVYWTTDHWTNIGKSDTVAAGLGDRHFFELPTAELSPGTHAEWRFFWPAAIVGKVGNISE